MGASADERYRPAPFLPSDARRCVEIFRAASRRLAIEDYSSEQCEAWAARADDVAAFGKRLAESLTLIATVEGESAGFASLVGADVLDMLFVDPAHARRGVGTALIDALVRIAAGARRRTAEQSRSATPPSPSSSGMASPPSAAIWWRSAINGWAIRR